MFSLAPATDYTYKLYLSERSTDYIYIKSNITYFNGKEVNFPLPIEFFDYPFMIAGKKKFLIDENKLLPIEKTFPTTRSLKIFNYEISWKKNKLFIGNSLIKKFNRRIQSVAFDRERNDIINVRVDRKMAFVFKIFDKSILYYLRNTIEEQLKAIKLEIENAESTGDIITLSSKLKSLRDLMIERDRNKYGTVHYSNLDLISNNNIIDESQSLSTSSDSEDSFQFKIREERNAEKIKIKNNALFRRTEEKITKEPMPSKLLTEAYNNLKFVPPTIEKDEEVAEKKYFENNEIREELIEEELEESSSFQFTDEFEKNYLSLQRKFRQLHLRSKSYEFPIIHFTKKNNFMDIIRKIENYIYAKKTVHKINALDNIQFIYRFIERKSTGEKFEILSAFDEKIDFYLKLNEFEIADDFFTVEYNKERKIIDELLLKLSLSGFQEKKREEDRIKLEKKKKEEQKIMRIKKEEEEKNMRIKKEEEMKIMQQKIVEKQKPQPKEIIQQNFGNLNTINTTDLFSQKFKAPEPMQQQQPSTLNRFSNKKADLLKKLSREK